MKLIPYSSLALSAAMLLMAPLTSRAADKPAKGELLVYFGTYTKGASKGIYAYRFQTTTGKLTSLGVMAEAVNPSFLIQDSSHKFLYAVNEDDYNGQKGNAVSAYAMDAKTGKLTFLNKVSSRGQ